jgi:long-chain acyl-CoA synthetase
MRSPALMLGYYKEPEKPAKAFTADGWLRTGDKGQHRRAGPAAHHRPREGPVQDRQGQVRGAGADRGQAGDARGGRGLRGDRRQPGPAAGHRDAQRRRGARQAGPPHARAELERRWRSTCKQINATLDPHEQLQCLVVVTTAWTVDNDVITPTFKVKRNRIEELYARYYEQWEGSGRKVIWQAP